MVPYLILLNDLKHQYSQKLVSKFPAISTLTLKKNCIIFVYEYTEQFACRFTRVYE